MIRALTFGMLFFSCRILHASNLFSACEAWKTSWDCTCYRKATFWHDIEACQAFSSFFIYLFSYPLFIVYLSTLWIGPVLKQYCQYDLLFHILRWPTCWLLQLWHHWPEGTVTDKWKSCLDGLSGNSFCCITFKFCLSLARILNKSTIVFTCMY